MQSSPWLWLLAALPVVAGSTVGATTRFDREWYASLPRPAWTPPSWAFGPVWTVLYVLMGLAARRVVLASGGSGRVLPMLPMLLFALQLALNLAWTPVFFGQKNPAKAMTILWCLLGAAIATTVAFWRVDAVAGAMLVPYLAWLGVAAALNYSIIRS